uniref:Uncharacterized protein n=1 Tax=Parascaris univalens TaxID=6257 RepID=A0A914ZF70_PARUN
MAMMRGISGAYSSADVEHDIESHLPPPPPPPPPPFAHPSVLRAAPLTRVSQSEPHLDIPHFIHGQDPQHISSLTRVLSGLFEVDTALSTPFSRSYSQKPIGASTDKPVVVDDSAVVTTFNRAASPELRYPEGVKNAPLRKSSSASAVDLTGSAPNEAPSSSLQQFTPSFHHGLAMTTSSSRDSTSLSSAAETFRDQLPPDAQRALAGVSSTASSPDNTIDERALIPHRHGGVLSVFGRGFFARPVIRSEEENYRYLMALDR